ncbi:MAG: DUF4129 domain-containing protein [Chitinophagaceae bacterium]
MRNKKFFIFLLSIFFSVGGWAQLAAEQSRHFDTSQLNGWKGQRAFRYDRGQMRELGLWERIQQWLFDIWYSIMRTEAGARTFWIVVVAISLAVIIVIVSKYKGKGGGIWSKSDKNGLELEALPEENIHEINFEEKIGQAIADGKYRLAIRLRYLYLLKILDDKGAIRWQSGKTNYDYIQEVRATSPEETYRIFRQVSTAFDFAWYGEHDATRDDYENVKTLFERLLQGAFKNLKTKAHEEI